MRVEVVLVEREKEGLAQPRLAECWPLRRIAAAAAAARNTPRKSTRTQHRFSEAAEQRCSATATQLGLTQKSNTIHREVTAKSGVKSRGIRVSCTGQ